MEVSLIMGLRLEVARIQDVIKDNPTSVNSDQVLEALEKYGNALEKKQDQLMERARVQDQ